MPRKRRPCVKPIFDGAAEAKLIALACTEPPEGYARWTIRLLAEKVFDIVDSCISRRLKIFKPHRKIKREFDRSISPMRHMRQPNNV